MSRDNLIFYRNGKKVEVDSFQPSETLLDYIRLRERNTGTKEGCNEGDCGACTVAMGRVKNGKLSYEPVNSCIQLLGQVDGADIVTVEDLQEDETLHPVQEAMVEAHGSQCGFCTPGFVMSLFAFYHSGEPPTRQAVNEYIAGNLCRCTGYVPIAKAALNSATKRKDDFLDERFSKTQSDLKKTLHDQDVFVGNDERFFASPASIKSLVILAKKYPDATIVSGATDVGLWVTKKLFVLDKIIFTGRASGFDEIKETKTQITLGAGATYNQAFGCLSKIDEDFETVLKRLGSRHVRASGTIGGNIANGSPIGDMPPILIALGASIELQCGDIKRALSLEDFFIEYGKQDLKAGELVTTITIPKLKKNQHFRAWKISKRFDQDISAVLFSILVEVKDNKIIETRLAFGGMAGTPKRAVETEKALQGLNLGNHNSFDHLILNLEKDFTPLSDMRASADYRMETAKNLLLKALLEIAQGDSKQTRISPRTSALIDGAA